MLRLFGVLAGIAVVAGACQWPLDRFGPDRTGDSASDITISPANARHLSQQWTASLVGPGSDPVAADGHVFLTASAVPKSKLYGFETSGGTKCTATAPRTCRPQWSDSFPALAGPLVTSLSAPAVNGGAVWVGTSAFENPGDIIGGSTNAYRVSTGASIVSGAQGDATSPAVTGNTVYASWSISGPPGTFTDLEAVDAGTGAPLFAAGPAPYGLSGSPFTAPAVSNGILYAVSGSTLYAFDATGTTNCGPPSPPLPNPFLGFSTFCTPLWTATLSGSVSTSTLPAVANGYVYIGDSTHTLYAFPARGCGAITCMPAWTAQTKGAIESSPAVTATTVFVGSDDGGLYAFPATGCGAATCKPQWRASTGGSVKSSPSVAGGVVYVGSDDDDLYAFKASGCGAATCHPLLRTNVGAPVETSPAIANGQVFVTDTAGTLYTYGLPATGGS
jgi:hypothetical protein